MRPSLFSGLLSLALIVVACQSTAPAQPAPSSGTTPAPAAVPGGGSLLKSIDRGDMEIKLVGEAEAEEQGYHLRVWVSRTELTAADEFAVFALVERDGRPVPDAVVVVAPANARPDVPMLIQLRTGPDGLVAHKFAGQSFFPGRPAKIRVSALHDKGGVDAELQIFVDSAGM